MGTLVASLVAALTLASVIGIWTIVALYAFKDGTDKTFSLWVAFSIAMASWLVICGSFVALYFYSKRFYTLIMNGVYKRHESNSIATSGRP